MTIKRIIGTVVAMLGLNLAPPALAQAMSPSWDPDMAGQGMVLRDMNKAQTQRLRNRSHGRTSRSGTLSPEARSTCRNKQRAMSVFGANDPRTRRLYALCAQEGY